MRKILVLRGGALGDFLVTLPALALLRERWPTAEIHLAGNATAAALAVDRGMLNAAHSQHERRWQALYGTDPLPVDFDAWLAGFDLVVSYWPDPDGELRGRFPLHSGQTFLSAAALPERGPAAGHYCAPLAGLGLFPRALVYPLVEYAPATGAPITLHPGSGSPRKNWPRENWLALVPLLPPPITIVLGEVERERRPGQPAVTWPTPTFVQPPLAALAAHLARSRLFLGHDSGVSHLAAACGTPSVLLFGPTDPAVWAPPAPQVRVIRRGPDLASISVGEVRDAALAALRDRG